MQSHGPLFITVSLDEVKHVAIALTRNWIDGDYRSHLSIAYNTPKNGMRIMDFMLTGDIRTQPLEKSMRKRRHAWAVPKLADTILQAMAGFCDMLSQRKPKFKYWLDFPIDTRLVDKGHAIELEGGAIGMTCATFVLATFAGQNIDLLDLDTWSGIDDTRKSEDDSWQSWILGILKVNPPAYGLSQELIEGESRNIPCLRYRPEDVVGACRAGNHPTPFHVSDPAGRECVSMLDAASAEHPI